MQPDALPFLQIPQSIQAIVYLVGMLGFPAVVAIYVLSKLSDKLKNVDKSLLQLSNRISERPMGLDRTTDFVIYICESLQSELKAGLRDYVRDKMDMRSRNSSREELSRTTTIINRDMSAYLRPIFRKHERFAARFPTIGGNLGTMFLLASPSDDIQRGQTEAPLVGKTKHHPAEAALAAIMNNIKHFGHEVFSRSESGLTTETKREFKEDSASGLLLPSDKAAETEEKYPDGLDVIDKSKFISLAEDTIDTICTILRDELLSQVKSNTSEMETDARSHAL